MDVLSLKDSRPPSFYFLRWLIVAGACASSCVPVQPCVLTFECPGSDVPVSMDGQTDASSALDSMQQERIDSSSTADVSCIDGGTNCLGQCVELTTLANCGACGVVCRLGLRCSAGHCVCIASGAVDCDGVGCVDITSNHLHCGRCGNRCGPGEICRGGRCVSCDELCPSGMICSGGTEPYSCSCRPGLTRCTSTCVDTTSDSENCGSCGNVCRVDGGSPICVGGSCRVCPAGTRDCNHEPSDGCETRIDTSTNCGACGSSCDGGTCYQCAEDSYICASGGIPC